MRSSRLQTFIWNGPISQNVSRRVISEEGKFSCFNHQIKQLSGFFLVNSSWGVRHLSLEVHHPRNRASKAYSRYNFDKRNEYFESRAVNLLTQRK